VKPESSQTPPGLYLVATPIGNLKDITLRALEVLQAADLVACEDTRVTAKLLSHYGISKKTISYNDHNAAGRRPQILETLKSGGTVALVSDAGTPLISDPGYKLVREAVAEGFPVSALPGASSVLAALCVSGLPTDRFCFAGFLPAKKEACRKEIAELAEIPATLVLFESTRRLPETLALLAEGLGDREAAVARELTKLFEECKRDSLSKLAAHYETHGAPKGEAVIVIAPPGAVEANETDIIPELKRLLKTMSVKEASAKLAAESGMPRKSVYSLALTLVKDEED
jgi:16S rRNA (cytidine1402-2'-O)-methyltransferase